MRKILFAILVVPALAWAGPTTASDWYKEGANQYTLGNFEKAIDAFKRGFELESDESKRATYLYNIAQSYRQANDCAKAQFFYRRFLSLKANDTVKPLSEKDRKNVEEFIRDLEPCAQQAASLGKRPPETLQANGDDRSSAETIRDTGPEAGEPGKEVATADPPGAEGADDPGSEPAMAAAGPRVISARFTAGGSKVFAGDIPIPVQATFAATLGHPLPINDKLTVEVGATGTLTPIPFEFKTGTMTSESRTSYMTSAVANGGLVYEVIPKLAARLDVGLGALFFSGLSGSRFIDEKEATGALSMVHVRGAVSADYAVTPNFVVMATPFAFSWSPPKDDMNESIKSLTSIDFMVGVGYRM